MSFPATVADFYLDKYEITVGRFRRFVDAGKGVHENPPTPGSGAHPLIAGSGWDFAWNWSLPLDTDELKAAITCDEDYETWTDTAGSNESRPMNCLDWYTAAAFCAWDGGRLPTEAEWNYAAAGGSEQREYPWGSGIDGSKASYHGASGCTGNGRPDCALTDLIVVGSKPAGNGRWGQSDLAGNVWEWTLDWLWEDWHAGPHPTPCDNCANLTPGNRGRVTRGGYFDNDAEHVRAAVRYYAWPQGGNAGSGARCARDSL